MSFWEPTEWFDKLVDLESGIDDATWNSASQDERERMLEPVIDEYIRTYGDSTDWNAFMDDLEDNNFHTECRMFRKRLASRKKATDYYQTDPLNMAGEDEIYEYIVGSMLGDISGDYGDISLEKARDDSIAYFTWLCNMAYDDIRSGKAKSVYDR